MVLTSLILQVLILLVKGVQSLLTKLIDTLQELLRCFLQMQHTEITSRIQHGRYIVLLLQISEIGPRRKGRRFSQGLICQIGMKIQLACNSY